MSGAAKTVCSTCGIPTKHADGICKHCRATTVKRPCRMCSDLTQNADRYCKRCTYLLATAHRYVPSDDDGLGVGAWVPSRGIRTWVGDNEREAS